MGTLHKIKSLIIICFVLLTGCATLGNPNTHAVCAALDTSTTIAVLEKGGIELNPIVSGIINSGGYPLFVGVNLLIVYAFYHYHEQIGETATAVVSTVRCGAAINNALLL